MRGGIFGWDLPPGCTHAMIEAQCEDQPCDICGEMPDDCICPECPECGSIGDPFCYKVKGCDWNKNQWGKPDTQHHGMTRTEEQKFSLECNKRQWEQDNRDYWSSMTDENEEDDAVHFFDPPLKGSLLP